MRPRPALLADPAQLKPGPKGSELLLLPGRRRRTGALRRIMIETLTLWCGDMTLDIAPEDQTVLSQYMYEVLRQHLGHDFTIVDQAGPGVMRLQISVIDFGSAPTGMHTVRRCRRRRHWLEVASNFPTGPILSQAPLKARAR